MTPSDSSTTERSTPARPVGGLLAGFLLGALAVGVVWTLLSRSPQAPEVSPGAAGAAAAGGSPSLPPGHPPVTAAEEEIAEEAPRDVEDLRRSALDHLQGDRLLRAFDDAAKVLAVHTEDPDALYVQAVVRVRMGQSRRALALLDRVLASDPSYLSAYSLRGKLQFRSGDREAALESWSLGLDRGGPDQSLQHLLDLARAGKLPPEALAPAPD